MVEEIEHPLSENEAAELVERCFPTQSLGKQQGLNSSVRAERRYKGFWRKTISQALMALGGEADLSDVYDWIQKYVQLTPRELSASPHAGRPYFVNTVRGVANDMCGDGLLIRVHRGRFRQVELSGHLERQR